MDMVVTVQSFNNWPALVHTFTRKSYPWHGVTHEEINKRRIQISRIQTNF